MSTLVKSFSIAFKGIATDKRLRQLLFSPLKKGLKAFIYTFAVIFILSFFSCQLGLGDSNIFVFILGTVLALIFIPLILSLIYFSIFCDNEYSEIARYSLYDIQGLEPVINKKLGARSITSSIIWVATLSILCVFALVISFVLPLIGILLTGVLLVVDFSRYGFDERELGLFSSFSIFLKNILGFVLLSCFFGIICFVPFLIIFAYPIGVLICTHYFSEN